MLEFFSNMFLYSYGWKPKMYLVWLIMEQKWWVVLCYSQWKSSKIAIVGRQLFAVGYLNMNFIVFIMIGEIQQDKPFLGEIGASGHAKSWFCERIGKKNMASSPGPHMIIWPSVIWIWWSASPNFKGLGLWRKFIYSIFFLWLVPKSIVYLRGDLV